MKSFVSASFFLSFEAVIRQDNPELALDRWTARGVEWERDRHSFTGKSYGYTLLLFTAKHAAPCGWTLLAAKEQWWAGRHGVFLKSHQWARPLAGRRASILAWFAAREREMESATRRD